MTTIFTVSVDSVEGATLRARVHMINADAPYVPEETVFPLSLLANVWFILSNGYLRNNDAEDGERYPYSPEQGEAVVAGMRLKDELEEIWYLILGKEIRVTADGYLLADDGETVLEPRRKAADVYNLSGLSRPGYSVFTRGDATELALRAAKIITSYDIGPYQNVPLRSEVAARQNPGAPWNPQEPDGPADLYDRDTWDALESFSLAHYPYAEIAVTVSDPSYLEHLVAGMRWETTLTGHVC